MVAALLHEFALFDAHAVPLRFTRSEYSFHGNIFAWLIEACVNVIFQLWTFNDEM